MPRETLSSERAQEPEKALFPPKGIVADQATARRLDELCCEMTDTCGLIEATLQLAVKDVSDKREALIKAALNLAARGTKSVKMFLSEWGVLVEESISRENSGTNEPSLLTEMERRIVIEALRETRGKKGAASRLLGIGRTTLYRKLKQYHQSLAGNSENGDNR